MQNIEALVIAATSATAAQQAAWQAAIIAMIILAFNIVILVVSIWIAHKVDLVEKSIQGTVLVVKKKDAKQTEIIDES